MPGRGRRFFAILLSVVAGLVVGSVHAKRHALLIGVATYAESGGFTPQQLQAPIYDVERLAALLPEWGFDAAHIHVLPDRAATRKAILDTLDNLLLHSDPGDDVLIYFSGHGTSWLDSVAEGRRERRSASALLPWDYALLRRRFPAAPGRAVIDVRNDLRPRFTRFDQTGRNLLVLVDACYSGAARGDSGPVGVRFVPTESPALARDMQLVPAVEPLFPPGLYRRLVLLSAAASGQRAQEIGTGDLTRWPTEDGKPHGVFTDALLRVLAGKLGADYDRDQRITPREMHEAISDYISSRGFEQTPVLAPGPDEDEAPLRRPLLGIGRGKDVPKPVRSEIRPLRVRLPEPIPALERALSGQLDLETVRSAVEADVFVNEIDGGMRISNHGGGLIEHIPGATPAQVIGRLHQIAISSRLRHLALAQSRGLLDLAIDPQVFGNHVREGTTVRFTVQPDRNATLVLLALTPNGRLNILYPIERRERVPIAGGRPWVLSRSATDPVLAPCGTGEQVVFAFAFDNPPEALDQLAGLQGVDAEVALPLFEHMLSAAGKGFTRSERRLRTVPADKRVGPDASPTSCGAKGL